MGYSTDDSMVRVDFFKDSGKWAYTDVMHWPWKAEGPLIEDQFRLNLRNAFGKKYKGLTAVCLNPHSPNVFPLMLKEW